MSVSCGPEPRNDKQYLHSYNASMPSESNELAPPEQFDCTCEELEKLRAEVTRLKARADLVPGLVEALDRCNECVTKGATWDSPFGLHAHQLAKQTLATVRRVMEEEK